MPRGRPLRRLGPRLLCISSMLMGWMLNSETPPSRQPSDSRPPLAVSASSLSTGSCHRGSDAKSFAALPPLRLFLVLPLSVCGPAAKGNSLVLFTSPFAAFVPSQSRSPRSFAHGPARRSRIVLASTHKACRALQVAPGTRVFLPGPSFLLLAHQFQLSSASPRPSVRHSQPTVPRSIALPVEKIGNSSEPESPSDTPPEMPRSLLLPRMRTRGDGPKKIGKAIHAFPCKLISV